MLSTKELLDNYALDSERWIEIADKDKIKKLLESKASSEWGQYPIKDSGYYKLSQYSPSHPGDKVVVYFCKIGLAVGDT